MSRALAIDRVTPEQLAEEIGCSPRHVRKLARGLGACRVFGKTMFLMPDDVQAILEASRPCPSLGRGGPIRQVPERLEKRKWLQGGGR